MTLDVDDQGPQDFLRIVRQHLIALRLESRLTVKEAAAAAGLSRGGLEKIESGANAPNLETLRRLGRVYHCSLRTFFAAVEEQMGICLEQTRMLALLDPESAEGLETLRRFAASTDRQEEWNVFEDLCALSDKAPELFETISTLVRLNAGGLVTRPRPRRSPSEPSLSEKPQSSSQYESSF